MDHLDYVIAMKLKRDANLLRIKGRDYYNKALEGPRGYLSTHNNNVAIMSESLKTGDILAWTGAIDYNMLKEARECWAKAKILNDKANALLCD
jgi:hypothetical protein